MEVNGRPCYCPPESRANEKPVVAPESMGETPMLPVIAEVGSVEMPLFARIT
jgi:hypothetical protein